MSIKLTPEEKDYILTYLDECNGGVFNDDVIDIVAPTFENDKKYFVTSADPLFYFQKKGIEAVENGLITYDQLLGRKSI